MRTKSAVTRTWLWGLALIAAGVVVGGAGLALMFASASYEETAPGVYNMVSLPGLGWVWAAVGGIGVLALIAGGVVQFIAWIGAMVLSYRAQHMTWFLLLLILGLLGFELLMMLVYVLAGPDEARAPGAQPQPAQPAAPAPPSTFVPSA